MPGHSRPKDGVASLAYDPGIHALARLTQALRKIFSLKRVMDRRVKPGGDTDHVDAARQFRRILFPQ
jgi:hypothetical protein